jgi:hypothetical protein
MTAKVLEIYDEILTLIDNSLPNDLRLANSYDLEANGFLKLQKAYAVAIGPWIDTERYVGCLITGEREFDIALTRKITTTENNTDQRVVIEKDLLTAHDTLRKAFYNNSTLGGRAIKSTITSDSGVNFIDGDRLKFLAIVITLLVEYQESPT